ncbi:MAG: nitroreductase family protein [Spirochaetaceae bacterium]|jgi:nitroreductase|nr:nitroreductase family protein [Spirochaetaceae bacterium]
MDFSKLVKERYSVRKFLDKAVEKDKLKLILEAARIAPTAANKQPQRILVLERDAELKKLDLCTSGRFGAPAAFIVCYDSTACWVRTYDGEKAGVVDASIVTTQMMLQACDLGLGTTWVMYFDPVKIRKEFAIPGTIIPVAVLPLGYPAPDATPADFHYHREAPEKTIFYNQFPAS